MKKVCIKNNKNSGKLFPFNYDVLFEVNQVVFLEVVGILNTSDTPTYLIGVVNSIIIKDKIIYKIKSFSSGVTIPITIESVLKMHPIMEKELKYVHNVKEDAFIVYKYDKGPSYKVNVKFLLGMMTNKPFKESMDLIVSMAQEECYELTSKDSKVRVEIPKNAKRLVVEIIDDRGISLFMAMNTEESLLIDVKLA